MTPEPAALDRRNVAELCLAMTSIASPTGGERPLAEWLVSRLAETGGEAELQAFGETRANVVARLPGDGTGPSILLYSPIDTAYPLPDEGAADVGEVAPPFRPVGSRSGDWIVGSGAENPKGYATSVMSAFLALQDAALPLRGDVVLALTAGGMPTPGLAGRADTDGLGRGCREFLARNPRPAAALIAKPGDAVSVEEAGIALFVVRVRGDRAYTGSRHRAPVRHALLDAARLVERLEAWFPTYTADNRTGPVAPQAAVTGIAGGSAGQPAFLPESCEVRVDLRIPPGRSVDDAAAGFRDRIALIGDELDSDVEVELLGGFPGAVTDRDHWLVRHAIRVWERRSGRPHVEAIDTSGVTDASCMRTSGIPTVRIGMPRPPEAAPYPEFSMGVVHVDAMTSLARTLYEIVLEAAGEGRSDGPPARQVAEATP